MLLFVVTVAVVTNRYHIVVVEQGLRSRSISFYYFSLSSSFVRSFVRLFVCSMLLLSTRLAIPYFLAVFEFGTVRINGTGYVVRE